jgi:hypothetical protein
MRGESHGRIAKARGDEGECRHRAVRVWPVLRARGEQMATASKIGIRGVAFALDSEGNEFILHQKKPR